MQTTLPQQHTPLEPLTTRPPRELLSAHDADLMRRRERRLRTLSAAMLGVEPITGEQRVEAAEVMQTEAQELRKRVDAAIAQWMHVDG